LTHTTLPLHAADAAVAKAFAAIPALLEQAPGLIARGRTLDCECRLGPTDHPFHASIRSGRIVDFVPAPVLMRSWRFSYRARPAAWLEFWKLEPRPGWHDLFALTKRKEAVLEGDLHPNVTIMERLGHFPMSENPEQFRRYIAPVLGEILKQQISIKQGEHA
jgi:hypothetical protein